MSFPLEIISNIDSHHGPIRRTLVLHKGLTVLLGPNGSGKTHLLRGLKNGFSGKIIGKEVRFLSAGRMGMAEVYRSDYDGHRGSTPSYDDAVYGDKSDHVRRHKTETLNGDFQTLAARADILIKIQERLRKLFKRELLIEWNHGALKILFSRTDSESQPYSSGREASGLMHLVGILSALYDDEVGALLLDEPEVSLHPQLQAFLLREIIGVAGHPLEGTNKKLVVIATHSTEMIHVAKPKDLLSFIFCYDLKINPVQIAIDSGELLNKKILGLVARLGQEHKLALFSARPLLVEGPSDAIICSEIAEKLGLHLEAAGSQLLPVIGKGQMSVVTKLMRLFGKTPVALVDADGITDAVDLVNVFLENSLLADELAAKSGFPSAIAMASDIHSDFCKLSDKWWDKIAKHCESYPYWINRSEGGEKLAQRRCAFCLMFTLSDSELSSSTTGNAWPLMKQRVSALLSVLEKTGLFVLRRGTIESYYFGIDQANSIGKPSAAADEMELISQATAIEVENQYSDVTRCLRSASNTAVIRESDALRDLLLAVVAPAHANFKSSTGQTDFNVLARSLIGDRSNIFNLAIEGDYLVTSIKSSILNISGFPLRIHKTQNAAEVISSALAL